MEMKFRKLLILMIAVIFIIGCSRKPEPDTLLRLGNKNISIMEFFENNSKENFSKIPESSKIDRINTWAENKLMTYASKKENFGKSKEVEKEIEQIKDQSTVRYYLDRTILDSVITEDMMKKTYKNLGKEVNASHILIQYRDVNPKVERTQTEAIALAEDVLKKIKNGDDFAKLAKEYSDDKGTPENGNLGYFGWGKMVGPFQEAAFSMGINEVSDIVETQFGYHIIKVNNFKNTPVRPYDEEKENIKNTLIRSKNNDLRTAYNKRVTDLKEEYNYKIEQTAVDSIINIVSEMKKKDGPAAKSEIEYLKTLKYENPIGKCNGKDVMLKDFITKLETSSLRLPPEFVNSRYFVLVIDNFYMTDLFKLDFEKRNIAYNDEFNKNIQKQIDRVEITEFRKKLFNTDEVDVTEKEVKKYYEENKETKYMTKQKSEVREIYLEDEAEAKKLLSDVLQEPARFDEFSAKLTERNNKKDKPGYLGIITANQYGTIGLAADTTAANTINPNLIKAGKGWSIIKVYSKIEPEPKDLKSVENTIRRILKDKKMKENREKVMDNLKKKYKFKIYWDCVNIEK
eukprot:Anaeramoba_ignava/a478997_10.p1 GENE.a478997_10~~a478997_10.p1  ORF type:complete len:571 (+),score=141.52 a478997_10:338-2050(+)